MKSKSIEVSPNALNTIIAGTTIIGRIKSKGDFRFDGELEGDIDIEGKLVVGNSGKIKGQVRCKNSEVLGTIEGKVIVEELLSLKSSAKIFGDIVTSKLAVEPGAEFTGTCNMSGEKQANPNAFRPEQAKQKAEATA